MACLFNDNFRSYNVLSVFGTAGRFLYDEPIVPLTPRALEERQRKYVFLTLPILVNPFLYTNCCADRQFKAAKKARKRERRERRREIRRKRFAERGAEDLLDEHDDSADDDDDDEDSVSSDLEDDHHDEKEEIDEKLRDRMRDSPMEKDRIRRKQEQRVRKELDKADRIRRERETEGSFEVFPFYLAITSQSFLICDIVVFFDRHFFSILAFVEACSVTSRFSVFR